MALGGFPSAGPGGPWSPEGMQPPVVPTPQADIPYIPEQPGIGDMPQPAAPGAAEVPARYVLRASMAPDGPAQEPSGGESAERPVPPAADEAVVPRGELPGPTPAVGSAEPEMPAQETSAAPDNEPGAASGAEEPFAEHRSPDVAETVSDDRQPQTLTAEPSDQVAPPHTAPDAAQQRRIAQFEHELRTVRHVLAEDSEDIRMEVRGAVLYGEIRPSSHDGEPAAVLQFVKVNDQKTGAGRAQFLTQKFAVAAMEQGATRLRAHLVHPAAAHIAAKGLGDENITYVETHGGTQYELPMTIDQVIASINRANDAFDERAAAEQPLPEIGVHMVVDLTSAALRERFERHRPDESEGWSSA